tara:strand:+ start:480 stop:1082 length:603 start_codon:yes stop_codon:yes gene_type:complete
MLRKIKLYGELAQFIKHKEFDVKVNSVSQAVSFLINNFPELEAYMSPKYYQVKVGNYDIDKNEIDYPVGKEDIHFIPVISGAGGGVRKFLLGAALIGVGVLSGGASFVGSSFTGVGFLGGTTAIAGNLGIGLALMGVSDMLFPLPKPEDFKSEEDPQLSFSFSGVQNTSRAGTPIPIVYGEIVTGSVVVSAATDVNQIEV